MRGDSRKILTLTQHTQVTVTVSQNVMSAEKSTVFPVGRHKSRGISAPHISIGTWGLAQAPGAHAPFRGCGENAAQPLSAAWFSTTPIFRKHTAHGVSACVHRVCSGMIQRVITVATRLAWPSGFRWNILRVFRQLVVRVCATKCAIRKANILLS